MDKYTQILIQLIQECGGLVEDNLYVVEPGCKIMHTSEVPVCTQNLFQKLNISNERDYENIGEFNARLCYLSFNNSSNNTNINDKLVELGHLSIYNDIYVTFLISGISDEVLKEFTAHCEAKISRLTSSKTKAMCQTLYRVYGSTEQVAKQKKYIQQFLELRRQYLENSNDDIEMQNMFNLGMKCTSFTFSMNLKDYHKLFIGRIPEKGNESDIRLMCMKMCKMLNALYPKVIRNVDYYIGSSNSEKYKI